MLEHSDTWGIMPTLFTVGTWNVSSYSFFVLCGILTGITVYFFENRKLKQASGNTIIIAIGSLAGGVLGAKLLDWIVYWPFSDSENAIVSILFYGKTIIGGMLGGLVGAKIIKNYLGIKEKRGNQFAPAVALGLCIGRFGCFFHGCCYGTPTSLPWGVNFGDGIMRHPTQIYESLFCLLLFIILKRVQKQDIFRDGKLFSFFLISYFIFRFIVEFFRTERILFNQLSAFQVISILALVYLIGEIFYNRNKHLKSIKNENQ